MPWCCVQDTAMWAKSFLPGKAIVLYYRRHVQSRSTEGRAVSVEQHPASCTTGQLQTRSHWSPLQGLCPFLRLADWSEVPWRQRRERFLLLSSLVRLSDSSFAV